MISSRCNYKWQHKLKKGLVVLNIVALPSIVHVVAFNDKVQVQGIKCFCNSWCNLTKKVAGLFCYKEERIQVVLVIMSE